MSDLTEECNDVITEEDNMHITKNKLQNVIPQNENRSQSEEENDMLKTSKKILKEKSKSAKNELEEIHKETQRIVRESFVSMPYHKPKQRSLTEFLQRRKAIPVVPLRTSVEKLNQVWKHLEEREKNAENFYKSDSEHEDEVTEKVNNSSVTGSHTYNNVKECVDTSDESEKTETTAIVLETDCSREISDTSEVCVDSTCQSDRVTSVELDSNRSTNEQLKFNKPSEMFISKENAEENSSDSFMDKNVSNMSEVCNESKPDKESLHSECTSNRYSDINTSLNFKEQVNILKFLQVENGIVDLTSSTESGVCDLMQRFIRHTNLKMKMKTDEKATVNISIISTEQDESGHVTNIKEDVINILKPKSTSDNEDPVLHRPGAKLAKLKAELQAHMVQRRGQEWSKRQEVEKLYEDEFCEDDKLEIDYKTSKGDSEDDENNNSVCDSASEDDDNSEEEEEDEDLDTSPKTLKKSSRIKNPFLDEEAEVSEDETQDQNDDDEDDEDEDDDDESMIPPYQLMSDEKDNTNSVHEEESSTVLSQSPAICLTALEGKDLHSNISFEESPVKQIVFTPLKDTKASVPGIRGLIDSPLQTQGVQDLMGLCSGQFQSQPIHCSLLEANDECRINSQDFSLAWPEDSQQEDSQKTPSRTAQTSIQAADWKSALSSDDETSQGFKATKKRRRKLSFSDDEDETAEENKDRRSDCDSELEVETEEPNRVLDKCESDSEFRGDQSEDNNREVDYDSEENEAEVDGGKFLDVEAELSESEWDSADEDESNLDDMENEEADKENIDEDAVKEELEKLHMKRMLVEDKKEVRLLQEMLLEDGELHSDGGGRKRLFRWSNNDFGEEGPNKLDEESDEDKDVEEEDELAWRRFRHEREMYLREHKKETELLEVEEDEEEDSQIIKLGRAALKKMNNHNNPPKSVLATDKSPSAKCSLFQVHSRGSFLARGQEVLTRLAHITTVSETNNAQLLQPKHSHNFVFSTISPQKKTDSKSPSLKTTKRKIDEPVRSTAPKRPCVSQIIKPVSGRKSLLEQLAKCES